LSNIEQHSERLPTGEDSYDAIKIAEAVAEKTGIMLFPCLWYMGIFAQPEYKQLKYGVIGYPTRASREKGRKVFEAAVNWLVQLIKELKRSARQALSLRRVGSDRNDTPLSLFFPLFWHASYCQSLGLTGYLALIYPFVLIFCHGKV